MNIIIYLDVKDLRPSSVFFCDLLQLFAVQHDDDQLDEVILNHLFIPGFKLVLRAATVKTDDLSFNLSIQVENCRLLFEQLVNAPSEKFGWQISNEFFGTYLSSPIGDQFAVKNELNTKILLYSEA